MEGYKYRRYEMECYKCYESTEGMRWSVISVMRVQKV